MVAPAWGTWVLVQDGSPAYWASLWEAREGLCIPTLPARAWAGICTVLSTHVPLAST